jgi:hypothetical protein
MCIPVSFEKQRVRVRDVFVCLLDREIVVIGCRVCCIGVLAVGWILTHAVAV